jgi:gamma-butyrobetaine dioxygenase
MFPLRRFLSSAAATATAAHGHGSAVALFDTWLRLRVSSSRAFDFHYRWLRHNCDKERHPLTQERTLCSSELPDTITPLSASIEGDRLKVRWDTHNDSYYALTWLEKHAYAVNQQGAIPPPSDPRLLEVIAANPASAQAVNEVLAKVFTQGAAVLRRPDHRVVHAEKETEDVINEIAKRGLRVIPTHFGRIEDLRVDNTTNANTDQLGYTQAAVELHTDQPFIPHPPTFQLLQCIRTADKGGENSLCDARAAALYLRDVDRTSYDLILNTPVTFNREQKNFQSKFVAPLFTDPNEDNFTVRYSYFTFAPYAVPFDRMEVSLVLICLFKQTIIVSIEFI